MSCKKATSPIDIKNNNKVYNCRGKCNLNYHYNKSHIIATNKKNYILLDLAKQSSTVLNYSTNTKNISCNLQGGEYIINEIRIYRPSLHTYNGEHVDAEILIDHKNTMGGNDLILSLPITSKSGTQPNATRQLENIIEFMKKVGNNPGEGGNINDMNFDLNDFIPKKKGFYTYSGTMPFLPCKDCVIFIVWDINDAAINLDIDILKDLKSIINSKSFTIQPFSNNLGLAYNSAGATKKSSAEDSIWIDCQPTGSTIEEEITFGEKKDNNKSNSTNYIHGLKKFFSTIEKDGIIVLGIILVLIIYYFITVVKKKFLNYLKIESLTEQNGGFYNKK